MGLTHKAWIRYRAALILFLATSAHSADWPMFGRDPTRNAVSPEKNPPVFWQIERSKDGQPGR
jgi:hypothetical protein